MAQRSKTKTSGKKTEKPGEMFHIVFDEAPISLWHEDFSEVKKFIDQLKQSGIDDLRAYCKSHPETVYECVKKAKVIQVNKATLSLYKAKNKKELLSEIDKTFTEESLEVFREKLFALAEGKTNISNETVTKTLTGDLINVIVQVTLTPGYEDTWAHVLVAITDISERKRAEQKLKQREYQQATISKLGQAALANLDLDSLFQKTTALIAETLRVEYCKVLELQPDGKALLLRAGVGWKKGLVGHATVGSEIESQAGYTLKSDHPVIVKNLRTETRFKGPPLLHDHGVVSGISVIIQGAGRPWGVLGVHTKEYRDFSEDSVTFIQAAANILALSINRKQMEIALERTNRALRTLSRCNGVLIHAEDETQLLCDICQAIIEEGGYRLAWVGYAEHDKAKHVRPIAEAGFDEGYLESLNITWADKKRGRGPAGTAIRNREPSIAQNIQDDPRFSPWREAALKHGYESCVALPIMVDDEVFGALIVYASEPSAFNEDEVNLLTELAGDIAFGISRLRMRARRLQAEEALQKSEWQYHEIIKTARDAFVSIDADGIITDWNPQAEAIFGWRRAEILGQPVSETIVPPEYSKKHTQGLKHYLATGKGPVLNQLIEINAQHHDGHTFPVELSIVPLQTNGTKRFNAFIRDTSARQKAKKALKASLVGTIVAISRAVEARDPYTAGHQQRVARLARCIAQEMDLDSERIDGLRMGATIHDIGKIYLPAEILSKPSKLTETEFKLIKSHCQVGYDILKGIEFPWPVADIAHQHHERLDGTGYPQGLKGEEICLEARIVAVADVVEAISSHRPYRPALGVDVALEEIETHRGEWYEPAAVDACLKVFRKNKFSFDDNRSHYS